MALALKLLYNKQKIYQIRLITSCLNINFSILMLAKMFLEHNSILNFLRPITIRRGIFRYNFTEEN